MSQQTLPGSSAVPSAVLDAGPSQVSAADPSGARMIGLIGLLAAVIGCFTIIITDAYGPRMLSKGWGTVLLAVGMMSMLYHAFVDGDLVIRRSYGYLGLAMVATATILLFFRENFFYYGWAALLSAICFWTAFARHETDQFLRRSIVSLELLLGGLMTIAGVIGGMSDLDFMPRYGVILTVMGLVYLAAHTAQADNDQPSGYWTAVGIGILGVGMLVYCVIRAAAPDLLGMKAVPFLVPTGLLLGGIGLLYIALSLGITSDNRLVVMCRKELSAYFSSPMAYLVLIGSALAGGFNYLVFLSQIEAGLIRTEPIIARYLGDLVPLFLTVFLVPVITMGLFAEERRTGTYEVLMSAPVSEWQVVLSKFFSALIFFMIAWIPWGLYLIGLRVESGQSFDYRPLLSFYLALLLTGAALISIGLFFSSLTRNQLVAAVLTFVPMLLLSIFIFIFAQSRGAAPVWDAMFRRIGFYFVWVESLQGRLSVPDMILHASIAVFWLYLTLKVLEARKWS